MNTLRQCVCSESRLPSGGLFWLFKSTGTDGVVNTMISALQMICLAKLECLGASHDHVLFWRAHFCRSVLHEARLDLPLATHDYTNEEITGNMENTVVFLPEALSASALGWSEHSARWTVFQPSGRYDELIFTLLLQKSVQQQGLPAARKLSVIKRLTEFLLCGRRVCQCWSLPPNVPACVDDLARVFAEHASVWFIWECCTVPGSSLGTLWGFNGCEIELFSWQKEFFSKYLWYALYELPIWVNRRWRSDWSHSKWTNLLFHWWKVSGLLKEHQPDWKERCWKWWWEWSWCMVQRWRQWGKDWRWSWR